MISGVKYFAPTVGHRAIASIRSPRLAPCFGRVCLPSSTCCGLAPPFANGRAFEADACYAISSCGVSTANCDSVAIVCVRAVGRKPSRTDSRSNRARATSVDPPSTWAPPSRPASWSSEARSEYPRPSFGRARRGGSRQGGLNNFPKGSARAAYLCIYYLLPSD